MKLLAGVCPTCKHHARWTKDREWEKSCRHRCSATVVRDLGDGVKFEDMCTCTDPFHSQVSGWRHPSKQERRQNQ